MSDVVVAHKSTVRRWIEKIADATGQEITRSHAKELAMTVRQVGEGGVVGVIAGVVDSELKDGLDVRGIPADLVSTVLGAGGAMYFAKEEFAHDLRNLGSHSFAIFTFRKTKELMGRKDAPKVGIDDEASSSEAEGSADDVGAEDPIVAAAREL